jgi:large subunit ribosomal protein L25
MSDVLSLKAMPRERAGKGASRAVRRQGQVPAVIYGNKEAAVTIAVNENELSKLVKTGHFLTSVIELDLAGVTHRTITRDVQLHPVTDRVIHIDFLRVTAQSMVKVMVPVQFINELASPGIKRGGVLNAVRHEVEIEVDAEHIPDHLTVDLTGLEIGASIRISAIQMPEGARPAIRGRDFVVATIAAPSGLKSEEAAAAAAAPEPAKK